MRRSVTENVVPLYKEGGRGAIGYLIKVVLTGYGYTFVAKGVEAWNADRLAQETRIYERMWRLQGILCCCRSKGTGGAAMARPRCTPSQPVSGANCSMAAASGARGGPSNSAC